LHKIVYAGVHNTSFAGGSRDLQVLAGLNVPEKQVERLTKHIGQERVDQREHQVETFLELPLMERLASPVAHTPDLAVVLMDGGRLQILDRRSNPSVAQSDATASEAHQPQSEQSDAQPQPEQSDAQPQSQQSDAQPQPKQSSVQPQSQQPKSEEPAEGDQNRSGHWREDKIGLLMTMTSEKSSEDPCPKIPENFVNPLRIAKLAREIKRGVLAPDDAVAETIEDESGSKLEDCAEYTPPQVRLKSMVGTRVEAKRFGAILAAAAFARGFFEASRKAFVADGAETNWTIHKRWFSEFVAILDFIHALSYVYAAAMAGRTFRQGWDVYTRWITLVWEGRVAEVIEELGKRQLELGLPQAGDSETHPRQVVADALSYFRNNQNRMRYDEYRRLGLPLVSSHVESTVKQFNRRVKGTEKFWSEDGAEAILQLRADYLSETEPMERFWQERETGATGRRVYRRSA
jgi:hypothetical protein